MKRLIIPILAFSILINLNAQDIERGYKALEKSDYQKAKDVFDKLYITSKNSPAVSFGLMVVYADKNSPFYDIVESWGKAVVVEKNINSLTVEEKEIIAEYFSNTEVRKSNWPANKKMLQAVGAIEANLIKYIREENNLVLANAIIEKFPDFRYYQNVVHIRNQLEFRKYEKQNTLQGYIEFMQKYPEAAQIVKATKYRDKLALEKAKLINTVEAYETYMKTYPKSAEYSTAMKLRNAAAFSQAKKINTIEAMEKFIILYPNALEVSEAKTIQKQLLYEYAKRIQTLEAFDEFIKKYPEGSQYIDIFNLKSLDLGKKTMDSYNYGIHNSLWTRSFDNKRFIESAGGIAVNSQNQYIVAGNTIQSDSLFNDAWVLKLDQDGKMIWNKIIGGTYNDSVFSVSVNNSQDIIALGYTYLGLDSASKEAWVFKLDMEGRKIWNRSLGKWAVTSMKINSNNDIILGGYVMDDSLNNRYKLMVMNNSGKKLWDRTYTSIGTINNLIIDLNDNIVFAGSKWICKMSLKGYIIWEKQFNSNDSITCFTNLQDGGYLFSGTRDSTKLVFVKIGDKGQQLLLKESDNPMGIVLKEMDQLPDGRIITYGVSVFENTILTYSADGVLIKAIQVPEGSRVHDIIMDKQGNLLFQYTSVDNILVIKNSGINF